MRTSIAPAHAASKPLASGHISELDADRVRLGLNLAVLPYEQTRAGFICRICGIELMHAGKHLETPLHEQKAEAYMVGRRAALKRL